MNSFKNALENNNINDLIAFPKVDIHNHAILSGTKDFLKKNGITLPNMNIYNIESFINYCRNNISELPKQKNGLKLLLKGGFENCINTGVIIVAAEISYKSCINVFNSNITDFVNFLKSFKYDNLEIHWDLGISRDSYIKEYKKIIIELLETNFFSGLDLASTENRIPNSNFIEFYQLANYLDMTTKVHAGEQLGSNYIKECILDFNPKQIQHGINIVEDKNVMELAKEKNIVFNICPTSNLTLGYVKNIKNHPIKEMVNFGLKVTIGTDDLLLFNSDINNEYLKLFNEGVLTSSQLNDIREFGLSLFKNEKKLIKKL